MMNMANMKNYTAKFYYKFRLNLNLPGDLNGKYTENLHYIITFQFNDFLLANDKSNACMQLPSLGEKLECLSI